MELNISANAHLGDVASSTQIYFEYFKFLFYIKTKTSLAHLYLLVCRIKIDLLVLIGHQGGACILNASKFDSIKPLTAICPFPNTRKTEH